MTDVKLSPQETPQAYSVTTDELARLANELDARVKDTDEPFDFGVMRRASAVLRAISAQSVKARPCHCEVYQTCDMCRGTVRDVVAHETPAPRPAEDIKAANRKHAERIADYSGNISATRDGVFERVWAALNAVSGVSGYTPAPPATKVVVGNLTCRCGKVFSTSADLGLHKFSSCTLDPHADPGGPTR